MKSNILCFAITLFAAGCDPGAIDTSCIRESWTSSDAVWTSFSAGGCGLRQDGSILCSHGLPSTLSTPGPYVWFSGTSWGGVGTRFCAVDGDAVLHCWRYEWLSETTPVTTTFSSPSGYQLGMWQWPDGVCALSVQGTVHCWYGVLSGQNWQPDRPDYPPTNTYLAGIRSFDGWSVFSGDWVIDADGDAVLYDFTDPAFDDPVEMARSSGHVNAVWANEDVACVTTEDGEYDCFGFLDSCGLSRGVCNPPFASYRQIALDGYLGCGIVEDGTIRCWGLNGLTDGIPPFCGQLDPPSGSFTQISAGPDVVCGVRDDGHAVCWGNDAFRLAPP